jgi:hypothetical protein
VEMFYFKFAKSAIWSLRRNLIGCKLRDAGRQGRARGAEFMLVSFLGAADFTCQQPRGAEARLGPLGLGSCQVRQFSSLLLFYFAPLFFNPLLFLLISLIWH